jgi:hypothetical protein
MGGAEICAGGDLGFQIFAEKQKGFYEHTFDAVE